jgi:tagatose-1,6-bisphosphate aldolase
MVLSIGKLRGLQQVADDNGYLTICAIDHRGALQRAMNEQNPDVVTYQEMVYFKLDLCRAVAPFASAVLLDPVYGAAQAIAAGILPGHIGLLVSMESQKDGGFSS